MKNAGKVTLLTFLIFSSLAILPMSCTNFCNDSCGCGPVFDIKDFRILSFETLSLTTDGQQVSPSTVLPYSTITKSFRIKETQTIAYFESNPSYFTFGTAMACSPPLPKSAEKMIGIQIINTREVILGNGEVIKVGQDISNYFQMNYFFNNTTRSIDQFLENGLTVFRDDLFKLVWNKDPGKEIELEFSLRIMMEGGLEFNLPNEILSIRS